MRKLFLALCLLSASLIAACNGGGDNTAILPLPSTTVVRLSTAVSGAVPADTTIISYDVTLTLPDEVTVKSSSPPETDNGVVSPTGAGSGSPVIATYQPASVSGPGTLRIQMASGNGMSAGEFCTISWVVAPGGHASPADFGVKVFSARGLDAGNSTVDLTTQLSLSVSGR